MLAPGMLKTPRMLRKIKGTKGIFYPKHLLPKGPLESVFIALTHHNIVIRNEALRKLYKEGKLREAVEFVRKFDFSRIPLEYFTADLEKQHIATIKEAISRKKYFIHKGRPVYFADFFSFPLGAIFRQGRIIISPRIMGANERETQIFREIVAEHELGHFITDLKALHDFPLLMEIRYALEKGKIKEWLHFLDKNGYPGQADKQIELLKKYYPEVADKINIYK